MLVCMFADILRTTVLKWTKLLRIASLNKTYLKRKVAIAILGYVYQEKLNSNVNLTALFHKFWKPIRVECLYIGVVCQFFRFLLYFDEIENFDISPRIVTRLLPDINEWYNEYKFFKVVDTYFIWKILDWNPVHTKSLNSTWCAFSGNSKTYF